MLKVFTGAVLLSLMGLAAFAQAPNTMMYQGRLTDASGNPLTGTIDNVAFTIYDDTTAGRVALWSEILSLECNPQGIFTAELGLTTPLDYTIFSGSKRWLVITVDPDPEMSPLQLLTSAPYAANANIANMPGVAHDFNYGGAAVQTGVVTGIDTLEITVPGDGYLVLMASGLFQVAYNGVAGSDYIRASISESVTINFDNFAFFATGPVPAGVYYWTFNIIKTTSVSQGTYIYYLTSDKASNLTGGTTFRTHIVGMYFPMSYGPTELTTPPMEIIPGGSIAPDGTYIPTSQTRD